MVHTGQHKHEVVMINQAGCAWNQENRFIGWADPPLDKAGHTKARRAALLLMKYGIGVDRVFTSELQRARQTAAIILQMLGRENTPVEHDWHLNQRHYGSLQGIRWQAAVRMAGTAQALRWRHGYFERPPVLPLNGGARAQQAQYCMLTQQDSKHTQVMAESLADTRWRVAAYWRQNMAPAMLHGETLLVCAHGDTLRALFMELGNLTVRAVEQLEIPLCQPILYHFDANGEPCGWRYLESKQQTGPNPAGGEKPS